MKKIIILLILILVIALPTGMVFNTSKQLKDFPLENIVKINIKTSLTRSDIDVTDADEIKTITDYIKNLNTHFTLAHLIPAGGCGGDTLEFLYEDNKTGVIDLSGNALITVNEKYTRGIRYEDAVAFEKIVADIHLNKYRAEYKGEVIHGKILSLKFRNSVCIVETIDGRELEIGISPPEFLNYNISKRIWALHAGDEVEIGLRPDPDHLIADYVFIKQEEALAEQDETLIGFGPYVWKVLEEKDGRALVITKDIIELRRYHLFEDWNLTWETSDMRKYLNSVFLQKFTPEERKMIVETKVKNPDNIWFTDTSSGGGNDTIDMVFLLSLEEVDRYFGNSKDYLHRRGLQYDSGKGKWAPSENGIILSNAHDGARVSMYNGEPWSWWLRSPGGFNVRAAIVWSDGIISALGHSVYLIDPYDLGVGVRPALWLNLESMKI